MIQLNAMKVIAAEAQVVDVPKSVLVVAIVALCGAIVAMWRYYSGRLDKKDEDKVAADKLVAEERTRVAIERVSAEKDFDINEAEMRAEFEEKHRKVLEEGREHEDNLRAEFLETVKAMNAKSAESASEVTAVLDKMMDRFTGGRRPVGRY